MLNIVIGTSAKFEKAQPFVENSIRAHTTGEYKILWADPGRYGIAPQGCTGFTNMRFAVPEMCGNQGVAIYLDVDMIVLADLQELAEYYRAGFWACLTDYSTEVMVIDCTVSMSVRMSALHHRHISWFASKAPLLPKIPLEWNSEDKVTPGMKLLHFTDLKNQPYGNAAYENTEALEILNRYQ